MAKEVIIELKAKTDKIEKDIEGVNKEINTLNKNVDKTEKAFEGVEKATQDTAKGVRKIGTTLKAIGIGLLLAAFSKLKEVFEQNQKVADSFNIAFETLSIAFNDFFSFLDNNIGTVVGYFKSIFDDPKQSLIDFADAFKRNIQERFESYLDTLGLIGSAVKKVFSGDFAGALEDVKSAGKEAVDVITGVNNSFDKGTEVIKKVVKATSDYVTETVKAADSNVELEKTARKLEAVNQGLIESYDRQAEELRQIRDDESKSFEERIKANEDLGKLLDEQEKTMMSNAAARVKQAEVELSKNKENVDLQIAYQEALNEQAAIEAQITGFRSEQQTNANSLLREQKDLQNELALIGKTEREIQRIELQQDYDAKKALIEREITDEIQKNEYLINLKKDYDNKINDLNADASAKEIEWSEMTQDQKIEYVKKGLANLAASLGKETAAGKAAAVASALISTYQGAQDSYTSLAKIPVIGPALGFAAAAAATISGFKTVKAITSTKTPQTAGMGGGTPSVSVPSRPSSAPSTASLPPQFSTVGTSGTNQIAELLGNQPPPRAFVVSGDVSTAQELDRNIVTSASLG
tara:strand:+ start:2900 stop:4639 length:1740 start_codon:yes stop_codon:yes gene_type:complete